MARPQTPLEIAQATGARDKNPGRYEARKNAPEPTGELGDPPAYFTDVQRDMWREVERTVPPGILTSADRFLVEYFSKLMCRHRSFDPDDALSPVEQGHLRACLGSMGLTPADRGRVIGSNVPKKPQATDPLDIILGAQGTGKAN